MFFTNWLRPSRQPIRTKNTKRTQGTRLAVEVLEDRTVPSVTLQSAMSVDSTGGISPTSIAVDTAGDTYMTGGFIGTADFDPAHPGTDGVLTSLGTRDAFVAKYAAEQHPGLGPTNGRQQRGRFRPRHKYPDRRKRQRVCHRGIRRDNHLWLVQPDVRRKRGRLCGQAQFERDVPMGRQLGNAIF